MSIVVVHLVPIEGNDPGSIYIINTALIPDSPFLHAIEDEICKEGSSEAIDGWEVLGTLDGAYSDNIITLYEVSLPCQVEHVVEIWYG